MLLPTLTALRASFLFAEREAVELPEARVSVRADEDHPFTEPERAASIRAFPYLVSIVGGDG